MKKLFIAVLASLFICASMVYAADESNLPDSQRTDQFTINQQTENDDQVKALIGAERIPVVDNARLENPQFVGERQGADVSIQLQKQTPSGIRSVATPTDPEASDTPSATVAPLPVLGDGATSTDVFKYDCENSDGERHMNNGPVGERHYSQSPATFSGPSITPSSTSAPVKP